MLRLGLLLGAALGAIATLLLAKPEALDEEIETEPVEGTDVRSRVQQVKQKALSQLQQARKAAREEAAAKEEEMRREFEETLRHSHEP